MSIHFCNLKNIKPLSKPRGQLGKFKNMTHSIGGYRGFQEEVNQRLKELNFTIPSGFFALGYIFYMENRRGGKNDVGNMVGALEDVFVKYGYLSDDNWRVLPRSWQEAVEARKFGLTILIFENSYDIIYYLTGREKFLNKMMADFT